MKLSTYNDVGVGLQWWSRHASLVSARTSCAGFHRVVFEVLYCASTVPGSWQFTLECDLCLSRNRPMRRAIVY